MWERIERTLVDLKEALEYLEEVQIRFKDNPLLLAFYEPSAKYLVEQLTKCLHNEIDTFLLQANELEC